MSNHLSTLTLQTNNIKFAEIHLDPIEDHAGFPTIEIVVVHEIQIVS